MAEKTDGIRHKPRLSRAHLLQIRPARTPSPSACVPRLSEQFPVEVEGFSRHARDGPHPIPNVLVVFEPDLFAKSRALSDAEPRRARRVSPSADRKRGGRPQQL